jgi:hypothetical protein
MGLEHLDPGQLTIDADLVRLRQRGLGLDADLVGFDPCGFPIDPGDVGANFLTEGGDADLLDLILKLLLAEG